VVVDVVVVVAVGPASAAPASATHKPSARTRARSFVAPLAPAEAPPWGATNELTCLASAATASLVGRI
jgi:hypothetical protein